MLRSSKRGGPGRVRLESVRITKVGVGLILLTIVVGVAAANTGNNALYLVEALLLSLMAISGLSSRRNLRVMRVHIDLPQEIFAGQPVSLRFRLQSLDRWLPKRYLVLSGLEGCEPRLIPWLARCGLWEGRSTYLAQRRGRYPLPFVRVASSFPLGMFVKTMLYPVDAELLVFPEIHPVRTRSLRAPTLGGDHATRRRGAGHELHDLREFREGDDPRGVHWKQSARTGRLVFMEREADEQLRLSIRLDNAVGELGSAERERRFERLVSEAASAAVHHLERGYDVELVTREGVVPFGRGRAHRLLLLEGLAVLEPRPLEREPLPEGSSTVPSLRLAMAGAA